MKFASKFLIGLRLKPLKDYPYKRLGYAGRQINQIWIYIIEQLRLKFWPRTCDQSRPIYQVLQYRVEKCYGNANEIEY